MSLRVVPITIKAANALVGELHRHHGPVQGALFALGCVSEGRMVGVAIVGRPVARRLQDGLTAEVLRVATDGTRNACSKLYGAAKRATAAMGYARLVTYTLAEEHGASLRAAGWVLYGTAGGGSWSRAARPRANAAPEQLKMRWHAPMNVSRESFCDTVRQ